MEQASYCEQGKQCPTCPLRNLSEVRGAIPDAVSRIQKRPEDFRRLRFVALVSARNALQKIGIMHPNDNQAWGVADAAAMIAFGECHPETSNEENHDQ